jgi:hypothetical protein
MREAPAKVIAAFCALVGVLFFWGSTIAMAITMGLGTAAFFPFFAGGIILVGVAIVISQHVPMSREDTKGLAIARWCVAIPLLLSLISILHAYYAVTVVEGKILHGASDWLVVMALSIPVVLWPEITWAHGKLGLIAGRGH